jgi:hypothetical protein
VIVRSVSDYFDMRVLPLALVLSSCLLVACEKSTETTDGSGSDHVEMVPTPTNAGWMLYFPIPEGTTEHAYRLETDAEFRRLVDRVVSVPLSREPTIIHVKWVDAAGQPRGPFTYNLDPRAALSDFDIRILEKMPTGWANLMNKDGTKLFYWSFLLTHRCGIAKAVYGTNTMTPTQPLQLGECNIVDPYRIEYGERTYFILPDDAEFVSMQLTYVDGSTSRVQRFDQFSPF